MNVDQAFNLFRSNSTIAGPLLTLQQIGLNYLTLDQTTSSLSGGELQRLKLSLNLNLRNKSIILNEHTTGLSNSDVNGLLSAVDNILTRQNTLIVIEHNL